MKLLGTLMAVCLTAAALNAQQQLPTPAPLAFEVASIKQNRSDIRLRFQLTEDGAFEATNVPLRQLIAFAYGVNSLPLLQTHMLVGGPAEVLGARFDVSARPSERVSRERGILMLRSLLADRFSLEIHSESRPVPSYQLAVMRQGRLGAALAPSKHNCREYLASRRGANPLPEPLDSKGQRWCSSAPYAPNNELLLRNAGTIEDLIRDLMNFGGIDRPLVNGTGLKGNFEWVLRVPWAGANPIAQTPSVITALSEQLGLKLEAREIPTSVWVIDSVRMPKPN